MISAETGDGVDDLMAEVVAQLPEGPHLFPEDQLTDLPMRLLAAEVTREHLFRQLHRGSALCADGRDRGLGGIRRRQRQGDRRSSM